MIDELNEAKNIKSIDEKLNDMLNKCGKILDGENKQTTFEELKERVLEVIRFNAIPALDFFSSFFPSMWRYEEKNAT